MLKWIATFVVIVGSAAFRGGGPPPKPDERLRVATWNLRNFPRDHDLERLRAKLLALDADVLAVQEVRDPDALRRLVPKHEVHLSKRGGRSGQRLGVVLDPTRVELVAPTREDDRLAIGGRVRPAFSARVRARGRGPAVWITVVHLKATAAGLSLRRQQWSQLARVLEPLPRPRVVMGDFNATGPPGAGPRTERDDLDRAFETSELRRLEVVGNCSAYWQGVRLDAWYEPSLLDLIWVDARAPPTPAHPLAQCARAGCKALKSTDAYPDLDLATVSDHCPVFADISLR